MFKKNNCDLQIDLVFKCNEFSNFTDYFLDKSDNNIFESGFSGIGWICWNSPSVLSPGVPISSDRVQILPMPLRRKFKMKLHNTVPKRKACAAEQAIAEGQEGAERRHRHGGFWEIRGK